MNNNMKLVDAFKIVAKQYPLNSCLTDERLSYTYEKALNKVEQLSSRLSSGRPGTVAVIYLPKQADIVLWQLAINQAKQAFLTLEWGQAARLSAVLNTLKPQWLITMENDEIVLKRFENAKQYHCDYIVFSSGSTGEPKKILLNTQAVVEVVKAQAKITQMNEKSVALWLLNPAFDASLSDTYMPLLSAAHLIISTIKPSDMKAISELMKRYGVTHTDLPPVVFSLLLRYVKREASAFETLKHVIFGGERADENTVKELTKYFHLYNAYGPTEATICASMSKVDENWTNDNIGEPFENVFYKIVEGELHIGGSHLALGYDDPLLDKKFYPLDDLRWYASGDLVEKKNNTYFYKGRKDRQFKYNGQLICPEEIESAAQKCGAQTAKLDYEKGKMTLRFTGELEREKLTHYLPSWSLPHYYEKTELTLNANWKVV